MLSRSSPYILRLSRLFVPSLSSDADMLLFCHGPTCPVQTHKVPFGVIQGFNMLTVWSRPRQHQMTWTDDVASGTLQSKTVPRGLGSGISGGSHPGVQSLHLIHNSTDLDHKVLKGLKWTNHHCFVPKANQNIVDLLHHFKTSGWEPWHIGWRCKREC